MRGYSTPIPGLSSATLTLLDYERFARNPSKINPKRAWDYFTFARHLGGIANVTAIGRLLTPKYYLGTRSWVLRKYTCGVVPSIFRNISIKALTLS
jgi:hypothetical protein